MSQAQNLYSSIFTEYPDIVSAEDVAKMLGIGRNSVYALIHSNEIRSIRVGRKMKIPKINVIEFLLKSGGTVE